MTATIPNHIDVVINELVSTLVNSWKDESIVFQTEGVFDLKGNKLTIQQAQDLFDTHQKIVFNQKGEKIFKLMYGVIQCDTYMRVVYQENKEYGTTTEWYAIKQLSADQKDWWSICRVHHCANGELIVSQFPGKFKAEE